MSKMMIFGGNANPLLTQNIANHLHIPVGKAKIGRFSDGEIQIEILENVRGQDVFIVQSTAAPTNDSLMELLLIADALRRASAYRITAVMPYFGYARQDRRVRSKRVPISAKVVADMMAAVGVDRVLTVDLHADQIQGFFNIPVDNAYTTNIMVQDIQARNLHDCVVVSPDVGGVVRARAIAKRLNDTDLAIIDKRRPEPNQARVMNIIGEVKNRACIIVDDIIDTAGTLCTAAKALKEEGASQVYAYCTHPVLSGPAIDNLEHSVLDELVVTDTITLNDRAKLCRRIRQLPISSLLSETIRRVNEAQSISSLFPA